MSTTNECAICGKTVKRKSTLKRHISIHSDTIRCNRCGTTFSTEDKLLEHNQKYHQKVYVCDECGLELKRKNSLQNHKILKHAAEGKKYECPYPDYKKICVKKTLFEDHMNSHVNMKQHKCGKCGKAYKFRYDMTKHAKTCGGTDSSKKCDQCDRTFSNYCNLNTHRAAVHNQKQYPCSCGKNFKYVTGLMKHRKNKKHQ